MGSTEMNLVAERVRMLEGNPASVRGANVSAKDCEISEYNAVVPYTPQLNTSRYKKTLRAAPAVPHQRRQRPAITASAAADNAELRVCLLPTNGSHEASISTRNVLIPKTSGVSRRQNSENEPQNCETDYSSPRQNPSRPTLQWVTIRDNISSVASRLNKATTPLRSKFKPIPCLVLLVWIVIFTVFKHHGNEVSSSGVELDEYIHSLNYSKDELLVYQGETLSAIPKGGVIIDKCISIERRKKSIITGKSDLGVVAGNEHRAFPGSLLLANQHLMDNSPDVIAVDRAPLTYTVNLPGLTQGSFKIVPSFSGYQSAVNKVLNNWFEKCGEGCSTTANFQSTESFAYSKALLRVKFGLEFLDSVIESDIDFSAMGKGEKVIKIYKFTQVFYTVSVEPTKNPSHLFDPHVTLREIRRKIDKNNPPVLVDRVSYGRNIYVKVETKSIENQFELNLPILESKNGLQSGKHVSDLQIQIYVIGGHPNHTDLIKVKNTSEIKDIIAKFSKFSKHNIGFPISYSSQFIEDNTKAVVHLSTDFVETIRRSNCQKALIQLIQSVMYGKWLVTWTEISFDDDGNKIEKKAGWSRNNENIIFPFKSEDIEIPGYVEDLAVVAKEFTVINSWRTVINRTNIPLINKREFYLGGKFSGEAKPPI